MKFHLFYILLPVTVCAEFIQKIMLKSQKKALSWKIRHFNLIIGVFS